MKRLGIAVAALLLASACGGSGSESGKNPAAEPTRKDLGSVSSVVELRDALVQAGYSCPAWKQDNAVTLAAESGTCSDDSVLTTYASEGDRQQQLDSDKGLGDLMLENGIEPDPTLVGPNWMFTAPEAAEYAKQLGGTVVRPSKG